MENIKQAHNMLNNKRQINTYPLSAVHIKFNDTSEVVAYIRDLVNDVQFLGTTLTSDEIMLVRYVRDNYSTELIASVNNLRISTKL